MVSNYEAFRGELSALLDRVDEQQLENIHRDTLATGIRIARASGEDIKAGRLGITHPKAFGYGERILQQLRDADKELTRDEVAKLDAFVRERLPETL